MILTPGFEDRLERAIEALGERDAVAKTVLAELDAFFTRHAGLERTRGAELIATVTIFERLMAERETEK